MQTTLLILSFFLTPALAEDAVPPAEEVADPAEEVAVVLTEGEEAAPAAEPEADGDDAEEPEADEAPAKEVPEVKVPQSDEEALEDVKAAVESMKKGQWATFGILLFGLLAFAWNRFKSMKKSSE